MNKLKIEHLSGYLPYSLKVTFGETDRDLTAVSLDSPFVFITKWIGSREKQLARIEDIKPILIPLEKFKDINSPEMSESNFDIIAQMELCELANQRIGYWGLTYGVAKICFEHHIDIFNLIPQGLAVEKSL